MNPSNCHKKLKLIYLKVNIVMHLSFLDTITGLYLIKLMITDVAPSFISYQSTSI